MSHSNLLLVTSQSLQSISNELPIFVISLKEATDRREHMDIEMQRYNLPFQYFDAIKLDWNRAISHTNYNRKKRVSRLGYDMSPGEIGCFLSHREIWKIAIFSQKTTLILEDDIRFIIDPRPLLKSLSYHNPFDIVRLHGIFERKFFTIGQLAGLYTISYKKGPSGASAYIVTPNAAKKLLELSTQFYLPVDDFIDEEWRHHLYMIGLMPYPVETIGAQTTIKDRGKPKLSLFRKLIREAYKFPLSVQSRMYTLYKKIYKK